MALGTPGASELVSSTLRNRSKVAADNFTLNNGLLRFLSKSGNVKPIDGGRTIAKSVIFAANGTANSYSGYDPIDITPQDTITLAEYAIAQYAASITISGLELLMNSGKEQIINLIDERVNNAYGSLKNKLAVDLYGDGTGNNGRAVNGLAALISTTPTSGVVGGIDRSTSLGSFWRNQKFSGVTDGGAAISSANLVDYMNRLYVRCVRQGDKPKAIVADNNLYMTYLRALQAQQRFGSADKAQAGFGELMYMDNIPVILDGGYGGGAPTSSMYFLNTDYMFLQPHSKRNFSEISEVNPVNQDALVKLVGWAGNLTMSGAFLQGVLTP
ncbi:phage major capsid protein [Novosphingobium sp.]|uniref:phage major capsid protein n=1 Tax=Novosphingobium sp. TaxID=1874826 RepID=UPI003D0BBF73